MRNLWQATLGTLAVLALLAAPATAQEMSNHALMEALKQTQQQVQELTSRLESTKDQVDKLKSRLHEQQKKKQPTTASAETDTNNMAAAVNSWSDRISISGLVEVEGSYEDSDSSAGESSDIALATVELGVDADISDYVSGHVLLLWEEDDTEPVDVDEGYITLHGGDKLPLYLNAGKFYVPFGNFASHFISDPLTLELGETRESAAQFGFAQGMFDISLSLFNGDVEEQDDDDNHVESFVGNATVTLPEDAVPGLAATMGGSYISNIADSDGLEGEIAPEEGIEDYVDGMGAFMSLSYLERFYLKAEYVGALDEFAAGELGFATSTQELQPETWNFELAFAPLADLELAAKYEGGDDLGDFLPDEQYGAAMSYSLFRDTALALEYLHGEYANNDERDLVTAQLAVDF